MVSAGDFLLKLSLRPGYAMMLWHVYLALTFTWLLLCIICLFSVANSEEFDVSNDLFRLPQSPDFDLSADDNLFEPNANSELLATTTSNDLLPVDYSADSDNFFGPDDPLGEGLMLSSHDECPFDAVSIDTEGFFLNSIEERGSGQACKSQQRGSSSGRPPKPPGDPNNFLDNLPIFEPYQDSQLHEYLDVCKPLLVRDRNIPLCLIGVSELALAYGQWFPDDHLAGCAPLDPLASGCPDQSALMCCKEASINTVIPLQSEIPGLMAQSDKVYNLDRCYARDCVDSTGFILAPWGVHLPHPAAPSHTPHR